MTKKREKTGVTMIRTTPEIHTRIGKAAAALGMSMNTLIELMIQEGLPRWEMQAEMLQRQEIASLFREWIALRPDGTIHEFFGDYFRNLPKPARRTTRELFDDHFHNNRPQQEA